MHIQYYDSKYVHHLRFQSMCHSVSKIGIIFTFFEFDDTESEIIERDCCFLIPNYEVQLMSTPPKIVWLSLWCQRKHSISDQRSIIIDRLQMMHFFVLLNHNISRPIYKTWESFISLKLLFCTCTINGVQIDCCISKYKLMLIVI